ncbi:Uncharacterised protein [Streptococcus equi subsp. equi]|nr:Uncharacterised protein [Streptococcus equi subsp. equi]CRT52959.1 Uncharacterised protein [Streptococcus equi subsp. equi]CRU18333.1 Uncharacterised protein [Streptococcus equi subsp. equi]CRU21578.1 Uncharacterised protein [Streptococcus equi subsp. equi]CRU65983.1 Uncharacterised protein [Streptococcus equi subsp. equi]
MLSKLVRVAQKTLDHLLVCQMHAKSRAVKTLVTKFATILLNQLPVTFQSLVFVGFSIKRVHDLSTDTVHGTSQMLHNVETIKDNLSVWEKHLSQVVIGGKHIHGDEFNVVSDLPRISQEVVANDSFRPSIQNSDDVVGVKVLSNKAHLALLKGIFIPGHMFG